MTKGFTAALCLLATTAYADNETNLTITPVSSSSSCDPISTTSCFDVDGDKNITHIFFAFDSCVPNPPPDPFTITVDGSPVPVDKIVPEDKLHDNGGPCNHGPSAQPVADDSDSGPNNIEKPRFWFPLWQNQNHARVCVTNDALTIVRVGAKMADECVQDSVNFCDACNGNECPREKGH